MKELLVFLCFFSVSLCQIGSLGYPSTGVYPIIIREDYYTFPTCAGTNPDFVETWSTGCQNDGSGSIFFCNSTFWNVNQYDNTTVCTGNIVASQNFPFLGNSACVQNYTGTPSYNVVLKCSFSNAQAVYPNTFSMMDYAAPDCSGVPLATTIFALNTCVFNGETYSNYTCVGPAAIGGVEQCTDPACSVGCSQATYTTACNGAGLSSIIPYCGTATSQTTQAPQTTQVPQTTQTTQVTPTTQVPQTTQTTQATPTTQVPQTTQTSKAAASTQSVPSNSGAPIVLVASGPSGPNIVAAIVVPVVFGVAIIALVIFLLIRYRFHKYGFRLD